MDLELSPEQEEFRKIVRAFAEEVVAPRAEAMDRAGRLDPVVLDQMAGMGLFGLPFPEEVGGMGADYTTLCLAIEELARVATAPASEPPPGSVSPKEASCSPAARGRSHRWCCSPVP